MMHTLVVYCTQDTQLPALFISAMNGDVEIFEKLRQHGASDEVDVRKLCVLFNNLCVRRESRVEG